MRVGVITPRKAPSVGGGYTFHETVLRALESSSPSHELVLLDLGGVGVERWVSRGLPVVDVHAMLKSPDTETAVRHLGLDVVWYVDPGAEVLSVPVFATVLDLAHRIHPFFPELSQSGWDWESRDNHYRRVLPRAARIFTSTHVCKQQIVSCFGVNPANVVVNPFPISPLAQATDAPDDDAVLANYSLAPGFLFYPAQFWPHKNHANLLLAMQRLEAEQGLAPELVLTGADHGNRTYIRDLAEELGLHERVRVLGFVPAEHMAALYRRAAALVFPSLIGPDNLPPLEAFSLGCPVLAGHIEGVEEQLGRRPRGGPEPGKSTFEGYFDPTDPEDMADAMARVLRDRGLREDLIDHGRLLAAERTPEDYVQIVLNTLDEFEPWRRTWPREPGHIASEVSLPRASEANEVLSQVGIFEDGWLAACSSLLLSAPGDASRLTVRGEVPYFGGDDFSTALSVSIDGIPMARSQLYAGTFDVTLEPVGRPGLHRIDLTFSEAQKLPEPDVREVGAKLDFIGFI